MTSPFVDDGTVLPLGGAVCRVPAGAALTTVAALRLARRLEAAAPEVMAVAAPAAPVPAGSSGPTDAVRRAARPWRDLRPVTVDGDAWCGVHRAGWGGPGHGPAEWPSDPDVVSLAPDTGPTAPAAVADGGRPPLPRGPVVVLLALDDDRERSALGARWADGLLRRGVEARLAVPGPVATGGLTAPCRPTAASLAVLRPDVVVALDAAAASAVPGWVPAGEHSRVDVAATGDEVALVSWRIGAADGDLHARVGPDVAVDDLTALLDRLCGLPPRRGHDELERARPSASVASVEVLRARRRPRGRDPLRSALLAATSAGTEEARWFASVVDQLEGLGVEVATADGPTDDDADLLLTGPGAVLDALAAARFAAGRPVARLRAGPGPAPGPVPVLVPSLAAAGDGPEAPVRALPPALSRQRVRDLRAASSRRAGGAGKVVVWDRPGHAADDDALDRARALRTALDDDLDLVVAADPAVAAVLADAAGGRPLTPEDLDATSWRAVLWDPAPGHVEATGSLGRAVDGLLAGVPVVAGPHGPVGPAGLAPAVPVAADDDAWGPAVMAALATPGPQLARRQVQARLLHGEQAQAVRCHRALGWLVRQVAR